MPRSFGTQPSRLSEIRTVIVDECKLLRQGLISLLSKELGILVVGDTGDGLEAVEIATAKKPDVVLINTNLPGLDGVSAAMKMRKLVPCPELVFLSNQHNESVMRRAFAVGGQAYLLQDCDFKELVFAIRKVAVGDFYLTGPAGRDMVLEYLNPTGIDDRTDSTLTRRELEMARLLSEGYSTKEAADRLSISTKTAEKHRASIMSKLDAKNVTDIVKFCIRNKIIKA